MWDAETKKEIDERIASEIRADVEFAENSPLPPPRSAEEGVYCEGCHTIEADWRRPKEQVMPPLSSVKAEWPLESHAANGSGPRATVHAALKTKPGKKRERAALRIRPKAGR